jgi:hypothetical protein
MMRAQGQPLRLLVDPECPDCAKWQNVAIQARESERRLLDIVAGQETQLRQSAATVSTSNEHSRKPPWTRTASGPANAQAVYEVLGMGARARQTDPHEGQPDGPRYPAGRQAVPDGATRRETLGQGRCLKVAAAHGRYPYLNYGQPAPHPVRPGEKKRWELQYALGDETRFEALEALIEEEARANYLDREPGLRDEPLHQVVWTIHTTHPALPLDRQSDGAWTTVCPRCRDGNRVLIEQHHDGLGRYVTLTCPAGCDESDLMLMLGVDFGAEGFELRRHRLFECNFPVMVPPCHHVQPAAPVFGHNAGRDFMRRHGRGFNAKAKAEAMGIDWMTRDEVSEAVPPAFTEHIGGYLMRAVTMEQAA